VLLADHARRPRWVAELFLAALALAVTAPGFGNRFVQDELPLILRNERAQTLADPAGLFTTPYWHAPFPPALYRPLATAALAVQWKAGGGAPALYRWVSAALLAGGAIALFHLGALILPWLAALAAAALFAVHPVHVEAVALGINQGELAVGLLLCWATAWYIRARRRDGLRSRDAAGILLLTGWQPEEPLLDPMCGSGTLLSEAAAIALGRAPGAGRSFGFEKLASFDQALWRRLRDEAARPAGRRGVRLYGSDLDDAALGAAERNLAAAGFEGLVKLERADLLERAAPAGEGVMVANPPYGERIGERDELASFYPKLGDALKQRFTGWRCYFFPSDLRLPKLIRLEASKRTPLFNGALECRLYEFRIVAGGHRKSTPKA